MKTINERLPVGAEFKYRNQKYIVTSVGKSGNTCDECEEANAQYIKRNPSECIANSERSGREKFDCTTICGAFCYPKRVK